MPITSLIPYANPNADLRIGPGAFEALVSSELPEPVANLTGVASEIRVYALAGNKRYAAVEPLAGPELRVAIFEGGAPSANYARALLWASRNAAQSLEDEELA